MKLLDAIQEHRDDEPLMSRIAATFGLVAIVMLAITLLRLHGGYVFAAQQQTPVPQAERTSSPPAAAGAAIPVWAEVIAHCMNSGTWAWTDPHTGFDYAAKCNVVQIGRIPR